MAYKMVQESKRQKFISNVTFLELCDRSTIIPSLFISLITVFPKAVRPPWTGVLPGLSTRLESAQGLLQLWVRARERAPSWWYILGTLV